jgi:Tfp pilus assembly PilM family ATPase
MLIKLSDDMQRAVEMKVRSKIDEIHVVDVNAVAEEIRVLFVERNVAYEDIAASVAQFATQCGYPVEFAALAHSFD